MECYIDVAFIEKATAALGTESLPLLVYMTVGDNEPRSFGPIPFSLTEVQRRDFDFGHAVYHDTELDKEVEIIALELTPFSALWKLRYEGAAAFHTPEADWEAYRPWAILEDKIGMETQIIFSDGSVFTTGGALTTPYKDGEVNLCCGWGAAIRIDDVQRIALGDLTLWEAE